MTTALPVKVWFWYWIRHRLWQRQEARRLNLAYLAERNAQQRLYREKLDRWERTCFHPRPLTSVELEKIAWVVFLQRAKLVEDPVTVVRAA